MAWSGGGEEAAKQGCEPASLGVMQVILETSTKKCPTGASAAGLGSFISGNGMALAHQNHLVAAGRQIPACDVCILGAIPFGDQQALWHRGIWNQYLGSMFKHTGVWLTPHGPFSL